MGKGVFLGDPPRFLIQGASAGAQALPPNTHIHRGNTFCKVTKLFNFIQGPPRNADP